MFMNMPSLSMTCFSVGLSWTWLKPWSMSGLTVPVFKLQVWKGFAGLFLHGKKKHCKMGPYCSFCAVSNCAVVVCALLCRFPPLYRRRSPGAAGGSPAPQGLAIPPWGSETLMGVGITGMMCPVGTLSSRSIRNEKLHGNGKLLKE